MLKRIDPLLNADVLWALRSMGHGDDLIVADANFPADSLARKTALGRVLRIDSSASDAVKAVLSVYPLDSFVNDAAGRMEVVGKPSELLAVHEEVQVLVDSAEGRSWPVVGIERFAFYERAAKAYCIIQTSERRPYGNFALRKGVVGPDD